MVVVIKEGNQQFTLKRGPDSETFENSCAKIFLLLWIKEFHHPGNEVICAVYGVNALHKNHGRACVLGMLSFINQHRGEKTEA